MPAIARLIDYLSDCYGRTACLLMTVLWLSVLWISLVAIFAGILTGPLWILIEAGFAGFSAVWWQAAFRD